ncbi:MAG: ATP-dependent DNA helicase RecG, partial [bacterium]|nr:ATP-dependent DNA helicase RecG [bacterium]
MTISDPVELIPLVGPMHAKRLQKLGIGTVQDLLLHIPFRYEDLRKTSTIIEAVVGDTVTIRGIVEKVGTMKTPRRGLFLTTMIMTDATGKLDVIFFNQPYLARSFYKNMTVQVSGKVELDRGRKIMRMPEFERIDGGKTPIHTGRLVPVYAETRGISSKWLRSRIAHVLNNVSIREWRPSSVDLQTSLHLVHFPAIPDDVGIARSRLAEDELLLLHVRSLLRRKEWKEKRRAPVILPDNDMVNRFLSFLPFTLTHDQQTAVQEILADLSHDQSMNRLLQGDVGAGKTVVAALAMAVVVHHGYSSLLMAPTEILAQQHFKTLQTLLAPLKIPVFLQTGSIKQLNQKKQPVVVVGTHALLSANVRLDNIGLIIIDEQHRFGVAQRAMLRKKGKSPHVLTMTATPIPRTAALTVYGDLDVSWITELPIGRKDIKTFLVPNHKRIKAAGFIREHVRKGRQAFIICPFIEPSENITTVRAATQEFERLKKMVFPDLKLGLLHGRLASKEKTRVLQAFTNRAIDILVSTPVVEVGIDIPNATIMLIEGAERFGLAQLHQLRGRVGRGEHQSFC